ncbi:hypothetical protein VKT23_011960 [Stygiomarasmius scandens]|uniref:DUF7729 domain-containing protein n=1 Tax=Marasmiellus scandens TaxID=2682957 RepID=A0ABR1J8E7_9AGAR
MPSLLYALSLVFLVHRCPIKYILIKRYIMGNVQSLDGGLDQCTQNMRWFEREMAKDDVCGKEMSERNDLVVKTRGALLAYPLLHSAACLSLSNTNTYSYVSSIAGSASHASDIYLYSLTLAIRFPDSAQTELWSV